MVAGESCIAAPRLIARFMMMPMMAVMEQVHQRTGKDQEIGKCAEQMRAVFGPQEECSDSKESDQYPSAAVFVSLCVMMLRGVIHRMLLWPCGEPV